MEDGDLCEENHCPCKGIVEISYVRSLLINLISFPTKSLNIFFIIKLKPFMSGEKVEGERVRGSSAEGGTHHRCTSGPKKGGGPIIFGKGSTYLAGGGGGGVCKQ